MRPSGTCPVVGEFAALELDTWCVMKGDGEADC